MIKMKDKDIHISYGTASHDKVLQRFKKISQHVIEGDEERMNNDNIWNADIEDENEDERHEHGTNDKAKISFRGEACIKIKLRQDSYLWYELISVDVEDRVNWKVTEQDVDKGGDRQRRKREVEEAVGEEDMDIFDDEEEEIQMS
jgi:hypothetical protein